MRWKKQRHGESGSTLLLSASVLAAYKVRGCNFACLQLRVATNWRKHSGISRSERSRQVRNSVRFYGWTQILFSPKSRRASAVYISLLFVYFDLILISWSLISGGLTFILEAVTPAPLLYLRAAFSAWCQLLRCLWATNSSTVMKFMSNLTSPKCQLFRKEMFQFLVFTFRRFRVYLLVLGRFHQTRTWRILSAQRE